MEINSMPNITVGSGALLVVLGLAGFFGADAQSWTALIPAFFGLPILLLGLLARQEQLRKHVMHLAVLLGLLGFLGSAVMVGRALANRMSGEEFKRPFALTMQALMAVVCAIFVVLCVRSFIAARRSRGRPAQN
jgi:hypothetical protein